MDKSGFLEAQAVRDILNSFISSYAERDKSLEFSGWLEDKLRQEIPDMPKEISIKLANEIIEAVAGYDQTLHELNVAIEAGQSKEEFFAEHMAQSYADLPADVVGEKLQLIESGYTVSNLQLIQELDATQQEEIPAADADSVNWNEYSLKDKTYQIGKKVGLAGLAVAANAIKNNMQNSDHVSLRDAVSEELEDGLQTEPREVKAAVAGAVKIAAVKGLSDLLPSDTPTEYICDMAGAAVEGAEALFDAANGDITMTEALDKTGMAGVAAACRFNAGMLKGKLMAVPVFGPVLVNLLGGLLDHMEGPQYAENTYHVVRDAAIATWKGIKASGKRMIRCLANLKDMIAN